MSRSQRARRPAPTPDPQGVAVRRLAVDCLVRIDEDGAYANLVTNAALADSPLDERDRHFVTDLVYGTTRMRRACDHLVDRHRRGDVSARVAAALRLGAYQLAFAGTPPHAAVSATVGAAPRPARGLVNAVLRRVADDVTAGVAWPDLATEVSQPDWIVTALQQRLGTDAATAALRAMNDPATTHVRADGYVQDPASQAVVTAVDARPGQLVLDCCAAPGGKATGLARTGARVVSADRAERRVGLIVDNQRRLDVATAPVVADATAPPWRSAAFQRVLVDAPCTGLGVLRRRPDARWRVDADAPERLARLQRTILEASAASVAVGGLLVYSVCTLTDAENHGVVASVRLPGFELLDEETLVPTADHDGMFIARWRRVDPGAPQLG